MQHHFHINSRFWQRLALFLVVNLALYVVFIFSSSWFVIQKRGFSDDNWESVLPNLPENQQVPMLFMGSSHGRQFHRARAGAMTDSILGQRTVTIAKRAADVLTQQLFLEAFYRQGNSADTLVYFLEPGVLFTTHWGEHPKMYRDEPLRAALVADMLRLGMPLSTVLEYVNHTAQLKWLAIRQQDYSQLDNTLQQRDPYKVAARIYSMYPDGHADTSSLAFGKATRRLHAIEALAKANDGQLVLVIPPHLLGKTPGYVKGIGWLRQFVIQHGLPLIDHHAAVTAPHYFHDHDHLNYLGIRHYLSAHLRPSLRSLQANSSAD